MVLEFVTGQRTYSHVMMLEMLLLKPKCGCDVTQLSVGYLNNVIQLNPAYCHSIGYKSELKAGVMEMEISCFGHSI